MLLEDSVCLIAPDHKLHVDNQNTLPKTGGLYKRDYGKSHDVGLADAVLAATAEAENAELKTLNTKHYPMFKGLKPAYTK